MKYYGLTLNLRDDAKTIEEYKTYHRAMWPEVEESLRRAGVLTLRIFLGARQLFMYMEAGDDFDPATYVSEYLREPRAAEWESLMQQMQEPVAYAKPGEWWTFLEPIYALGSNSRDGVSSTNGGGLSSSAQT